MNIDLDEVERNEFTIAFTNQTSTPGSIFYTTNPYQAPEYTTNFVADVPATTIRFPFRVTQFCQYHQLDKKYKVWYSLATICTTDNALLPGDAVFQLGLRLQGSLSNTYFLSGNSSYVGQLNKESTNQNAVQRTGIYTAITDNPPFIATLSSECTYIEMQVPYIKSDGSLNYLNLYPTANPPAVVPATDPVTYVPAGVSFILQLHFEEL